MNSLARYHYMASQSSAAESRSLVSFPSNVAAYVVIVAALVTAVIHLVLAPRIMGFDRTQGVLFYLHGIGFIGGTLLFVTRYWRRWLYLVAVGYALATIVAFFVMGGSLNALAIVSKAAEAVVALGAAYLYVAERPT